MNFFSLWIFSFFFFSRSLIFCSCHNHGKLRARHTKPNRTEPNGKVQFITSHHITTQQGIWRGGQTWSEHERKPCTNVCAVCVFISQFLLLRWWPNVIFQFGNAVNSHAALPFIRSFSLFCYSDTRISRIESNRVHRMYAFTYGVWECDFTCVNSYIR